MIDVPQVLNLLEIAVSERGEDFHYEDYLQTDYAHVLNGASDCRYSDGAGSPLCIAGMVLNEVGLLDYVSEGSTVTTDQPRLIRKVSHDGLQVLLAAQVAQDTGQSWGYALQAARLKADELAS